jgi:putative flippase GtrA
MVIALSCLWLSHYALGLDSPIADNISANVIGLGLGTLFRFWSYRKWVFPAIADDDDADRELAERDAVTPI